MSFKQHRCWFPWCFGLLVLCFPAVFGTPANKAGLEYHYETFLPSHLARCSTCHLPSEHKDPQSLEEFPHNAFGARLRAVRAELGPEKQQISELLSYIAEEDSDGDGIENEKELLLGHHPGRAGDKPGSNELEQWPGKEKEFQEFLREYRWRPFQAVTRPPLPQLGLTDWVRNPIDVFVGAEHQQRGLRPQPEASKEVLLRRLYLDVIGLLPSIEEQESFLADQDPQAYERLVERLLEDPRHGERWARHWMDIWRYSDWGGWSGGNQIRDSQPHIWRWRDWIIQSLNENKPYDRMVLEMLAADELAPEDTNALRATGYLVRNYKMLSREQWLEDTIKHTGQAFLGLTVGCAKCHDHMTEPISQAEYYQLRAIFEPHRVRTDRIPGELDRSKNGLVRVYDTDTNAITYFLLRGDERTPDTNRVMSPGVLRVLGGKFEPSPLGLPKYAAQPDKREFVIRDTIAASEAELRKAEAELEKNQKIADLTKMQWRVDLAQAKHQALLRVLQAEQLEDDGKKETEEWCQTAMEALRLQRSVVVFESKLKLHDLQLAKSKALAKVAETTRAFEEANAEKESEREDSGKLEERRKAAEKAKADLADSEKKVEEAEKKLAEAEQEYASAPGVAYKPRDAATFPQKSTGRRLAFARWVANERNPLTARVAVNHIWLRHFGRGIVATPADFGRNGQPPTHPQLLDWLAAELMAQGWRMKEIHRLILTSSTYRLASTSDASNGSIDPDNLYLWRAPTRRMEAELVRDNLLSVAGDLDPAMGGPEIDHNLGLVSQRRSVYLRIGPEKEVEFMRVFDGPTITECYLRRPTVIPQQALALNNSELTLREARRFAEKTWSENADEKAFIQSAFRHLLCRQAKEEELALCQEFLIEQRKVRSPERARENLALVLMNHNDFVTIR